MRFKPNLKVQSKSRPEIPALFVLRYNFVYASTRQQRATGTDSRQRRERVVAIARGRFYGILHKRMCFISVKLIVIARARALANRGNAARLLQPKSRSHPQVVSYVRNYDRGITRSFSRYAAIRNDYSAIALY